MAYSIIWTEESEHTFTENVDYLSLSWDLITINKFLDRVDEVILTIKDNPKLYPLYQKKTNVRKCVVNKHITLYYKIVNESRIDLLTFWNTHQNPDYLKY